MIVENVRQFDKRLRPAAVAVDFGRTLIDVITYLAPVSRRRCGQRIGSLTEPNPHLHVSVLRCGACVESFARGRKVADDLEFTLFTQ